MEDDVRPFPIQGGYNYATETRVRTDKSTIPWWLAEIAYAQYAKLGHGAQSIERIAERGGFGREELVKLLRNEDPFR